MERIREEHPVARKKYICNASEYVRDFIGEKEFTISELRQMVKARRSGWCVVPGQRYVKVVQSDGGEIITYRAIPEMDAICDKYNLWPEW